MITQDDINLAITVCKGDRNAYRLASWLSEYKGHWDSYMMADLKAHLGLAKDDIDDEIAVGIRSLLESGPRHGPRLQKQARQQKQIEADLLREG